MFYHGVHFTFGGSTTIDKSNFEVFPLPTITGGKKYGLYFLEAYFLIFWIGLSFSPHPDYAMRQPWIRIYYPYIGQWYEHGFRVFNWFIVSWGRDVFNWGKLPLFMIVKDE